MMEENNMVVISLAAPGAGGPGGNELRFVEEVGYEK